MSMGLTFQSCSRQKPTETYRLRNTLRPPGLEHEYRDVIIPWLLAAKSERKLATATDLKLPLS